MKQNRFKNAKRLNSVSHILFLTAIIAILNSCHILPSRKSDSVQMKLAGRYLLELPDTLPYEYPTVSTLRIDGQVTTIDISYSPFGRNYRLERFNLISGELIKSVPMRLLDYQNLWRAEEVGKDSFIVAINPYASPSLNEGCRLLVNEKAEILDTFTMEGSILLRPGHPEYGPNFHMYASNKSFPFYYNKEEGSVLVKINDAVKRGNVYADKPYSWLGKAYLKSKNKEFEYINYPDMDEYYQEVEHIESIYDRGGKTDIYGSQINDTILLMSRSLNSKVHYLNLRTNGVTVAGDMPSDFIPADYLKIWKTDVEKARFSQAVYRCIYYDSNRELYYRTQVIPFDSVSPSQVEDPVFSVSVFTKDFKKLGEMIMPHGYNWKSLVPYKNGFIIHNYPESINKKNHVFDYFECEVGEASNPSPREQMKVKKDELLRLLNNQRCDTCPEEYVSNFPNVPKKDTLQVLLYPVERSCLSCSKLLSEAFTELNTSLNNDILVILIASNKYVLKKFLEDNKLSLNDNFRSDITGVYKPYLADWVNPRVLTYNQDRKVIKDVIYDADQIPELVRIIHSKRISAQ